MSSAKEQHEDWPAWATEKVEIAPPDPTWPAKAEQQKQELRKLLAGHHIQNIEHIGSTSIPGLPAKPIIDLAAEIPSFDTIPDIAEHLKKEDWHYVPPELDQRPERRFFIKVSNNKRAVHLHFLLPESRQWQDYIKFKTILLENQTIRSQYAELKARLAAKHSDDRERYTNEKSTFIKRAMKQKLIFATNNANKVVEIQAAIGDKLEVISLKAAGIDIDIPEPHDTLEANATEKSTTIHNLTKENCFSEDTGLEITALNGEPGVKSARYAGEDRAFQKNIEKVLEKLKDNPNREARFRTVISLIWQEKEYLFEGICNGRILNEPTGSDGFGYDPIFVPEGETRSFAQMTMEEKNRYSHRRKAADKLIEYLQNNA